MAACTVNLIRLVPVLVFVCMVSSLPWKLHGQESFDQNYVVEWGGDHVSLVNQGREVQLVLDQTSGARFASKKLYMSGLFHMKMKLSDKNTAGVVTCFYLMSPDNNNHDELDIEFLGNVKGKPVILQSNIFTYGHGNREQRIHLWFDPAADFHDYRILWNPYQIVFSVDDTPIRVYRNLKDEGVQYPSQAMHVTGSIWNGEDWATDGGRTKINWGEAPFVSHYQIFRIDGCSSSEDAGACSSAKLWWNAETFQELTPQQKAAYQNVKQLYMTYNYCTDNSSSYKPPPAECNQ